MLQLNPQHNSTSYSHSIAAALSEHRTEDQIREKRLDNKLVRQRAKEKKLDNLFYLHIKHIPLSEKIAMDLRVNEFDMNLLKKAEREGEVEDKIDVVIREFFKIMKAHSKDDDDLNIPLYKFYLFYNRIAEKDSSLTTNSPLTLRPILTASIGQTSDYSPTENELRKKILSDIPKYEVRMQFSRYDE